MTNMDRTDMMIELLAKLVMGDSKIKEIVTKNKRDPPSYIKGYNSCNGENTVTEIAEIIGVAASTLTPILKDWERAGIVYNIGPENKPKYKKIMRI